MEDDQERLLSILQAHGQQFLNSFDIPTTSKRKRRRSSLQDVRPSRYLATEESESNEEWKGFEALGDTRCSSPESGSTEESDDGV
ncbi:hypothetical protein BS17DRAFT_775674 [Gyrodon lividus]|nr:hypothetical protein BS17DRAFT_775674 [Gyrodon lividus]